MEVELVVDHRGAELGAQAGDGEDFLALPDGAVAAAALHDPGTHAQIPITEKKIDSRASSTMTRKIASTTARVVWRPTDSALRETCSPSSQPTMPKIGRASCRERVCQYV